MISCFPFARQGQRQRSPDAVAATAVTQRRAQHRYVSAVAKNVNASRRARVTAKVPQPPESLISIGQLTKANPYIEGIKQATYRSGFYALYSGRWRDRGTFYNWMAFDVIWLAMFQSKGVIPRATFRGVDGRIRRKFAKSMRELGPGRYRFVSQALRDRVVVRKSTGATDAEQYYEVMVPVSVMNTQLMHATSAVFLNPPDGEEEKDDPLNDPNVVDMPGAAEPEDTDESAESDESDGTGSPDADAEPSDAPPTQEEDKKAGRDLKKYSTRNDADGRPDPTLGVIGSFRPEAVDPYMAAASKIVPPTLWAEIKKSLMKILISQIPIVGGNLSVMSLHFKIDKETSQQLLASDFVSSSPADMHSLVRNWVAGGINVLAGQKRPPAYILSLPRIRAMAPTVGRPDIRVNELGISVSPTGQLYWLPREQDRINEYISEQESRLKNEADNTYTSFTQDEGQDHIRPKPKLSDRFVYMDWINQKASYTAHDGTLSYLATDRFTPAKPSHYANVLRRSLYEQHTDSVISFAYTLAKGLNIAPSNTPAAWKDFRTVVIRSLRAEGLIDSDTPESDLRVLDFFQPESQAVNGLILIFKALDEYLKENSDIAYTRYSVTTVLRVRGFLGLTNQFDPDTGFAAIAASDKADRDKYIHQGVPEGFDGIDIPFVRNDPNNPLKILGHQNRVMGRLSTNPDNGVLGVDAGGGKTPMSLFDILSELKAGNISRPIIMCPNYLVANHITDGIEFTGGQVNFIPITTSVLRRHGLKGIEKFLMNRPINSVVVVGFSVLSRQHTINYGMQSTKIYWFADFLRRFDFDMAVVDESHHAKNDSGIQRGIHRVMAMCKKKRIMSGTLAPNNIIDLVMQFALIDPTVFGSIEDFKRKYADEMKGSKVISWKPGTEVEVQRLISGNSAYASVNRVEWEAVLPEKKESIIAVDLTPTQSAVYQCIMNEAFAFMPDEQKAKLVDLLAVSARLGTPEELPTDSEYDEDSIVTDIESIVNMYLARIEQFCTAPAADLAGQTLTGDDRVSAKVRKVGDICLRHVSDNLPGKIIIFTNYVASAEAVYDYLNTLPQFAGRVVHYTASDKDNAKAEFKENPSKLVMVGVGKSMDTGLNLQHGSRLIRVEGVWSPGTIEQGNARIWRPVFSADGDKRPAVYIDTIVAMGTIDITKFALLVAKTVSVEKFKNAGNAHYDTLEVPETLKMTVENILEFKDFETIQTYFNAYSELNDARVAHYDEYRAQHPEGIQWHDVRRSQNLDDAKIMLRVPYIPQMELYKAKDLGLIRYDRAAKLDEEELRRSIGDDVRPDTEEGSATEKDLFMYAPVHTEFGDGEISRINKSTISVQLASGTRVDVHKLEAFLIQRSATNSHDMKKLMSESTTDIALDQEPEVPAVRDSLRQAKRAAAERRAERQRRREERNQPPVVEDVVRPELNLGFNTINGAIGLRVRNSDEGTLIETLQQYGFRAMPQVYYAKIDRAEHLLSLIYAWAEAGYTMDAEYADSLFDYVMLMFNFRSKIKDVNPHEVMNKSQIVNFLRTTFRPARSEKKIKPYPWIMDEKFYIALPFAFPASKAACADAKRKITKTRTVDDPRTVNRNGIATRTINIVGKPLTWYKTSGNELYFLGTKAEMKRKVRELISAGYNIVNAQELSDEYSQLKVIPGNRRSTN